VVVCLPVFRAHLHADYRRFRSGEAQNGVSNFSTNNETFFSLACLPGGPAAILDAGLRRRNWMLDWVDPVRLLLAGLTEPVKPSFPL